MQVTSSRTKIDDFLEDVQKSASVQREMIIKEADELYRGAMADAQAEIARETEAILNREKGKIHANISAETYKKKAERKRTLLKRREEIRREIFKAAEEKLSEMTETKEYENFLVEAAAEVGKVLNLASDVVFYVRECDMKYEKAIKEAFGRECAVEGSKDIGIGGLLAVSQSAGIEIDETLMSKLYAQAERFAEVSKLEVM